MQPAADCHAALNTFARKAFETWRGLPADCAAEELFRVAPLLNTGIARGVRGRSKRWLYSRVVRFERYAEPVRVWQYALEDKRIVLLEVDYPALPQAPNQLLQVIGEPEARLDCYWDILRLPAGEWVYPARGISLLVNVPTRTWLRVTVFAATTLTKYLEELRLDTTPAELDLPLA
jgi:hypothetical protein